MSLHNEKVNYAYSSFKETADGFSNDTPHIKRHAQFTIVSYKLTFENSLGDNVVNF